MKQEAWIKQLRDRLADHEEAAPADLWADGQQRQPFLQVSSWVVVT